MQPHRNLQLPPPENSSFPTLSFSRRPHHLTRPQRTRSTCAQSTLCHLARCERASHTENAPTQETSQPDVLRSPRLNVANEAHRESRRFIQALCGYSSRRPTWSCRTRCRHHHGPARSDTPVRPCTSAQRQPPSRLCSWGSRHCPALAPVRAQARVPKPPHRHHSDCPPQVSARVPEQPAPPRVRASERAPPDSAKAWATAWVCD